MNIEFGKIQLTLLAAMGLAAVTFSASAEVLKYNQSDADPNGYYAAKMIKLALEHIDTKYELEVVPGDLTQTRMVEDTLTNSLDIIWAGTSRDLEEQLELVKIPLYKGLLGHRILIIRKEDQAKFDQVKNIEDLRKIRLGQGTAWADTKILEANGLNVVKTMKYINLFFMLDGGRFDAFPRAVFEPFSEVEKHSGLNLTVEKHLMLVYKLDFFLFVNKNKKKLARDLELGLNRAIADGSFDKVFLSAPSVQEAITKGDLKNRLIIPLKNPLITDQVPVDREELWIDPKSL
jgi:ABC-type amino acid transport substrate-binding protein